MLPQIVTVGPLAAASSNNIALSQTTGGAANLNINGALASGGVATLDTPRRVLITSAGNDSGITFTVTGTNHTGNPIRETVTGANTSSVYTLQDFATVTRIATSGATAGNVTVGTNGVASSPWKVITFEFGSTNLAFGVTVSGTTNYSIEYTYDNPNNNQANMQGQGNGGSYPTPPTAWALAALSNKTANADGSIGTPIYAWRLTLNSQTNPGFATATGIQSGIINGM